MYKLAPYSAAMLSCGALASPVESLAQPIFVVDSQSIGQSNVGTTAQYALQFNNGTAGILVLFCWSDIESTGPGFSITGGTLNGTNTSLITLASQLQAVNSTSGPSGTNQGIVIGVKGGACAPSWLSTLTTLPNLVPMPTFYTLPWQKGSDVGTPTCGTATPLPASWDATYEAQYESVVSSLVGILSNYTLTNDTSHTLRDHLVAVADGAMIQTGTDEMGVFSDGCSITSTSSTSQTVAMSRYQVAQTWASLPWPDNYTPAKAQAAYRHIFDNLLNLVASLPHNIFGSQVAVTQTLDGSDSHDWPAIDANGIPVPPQDPPVAPVPMYAPILAQAANDARDCFSNHGTLSGGGTIANCLSTSQTTQVAAAADAIFGWPGFFNDSTSNSYMGTAYSGLATKSVVLIVNSGALNGGGIKWQTNNDSNGATIIGTLITGLGTSGLPTHGDLTMTSCVGREAVPADVTPPLADWSCFGTMEVLALQSSQGAISTATTLSLGTDVSNIGINPPSTYSATTKLLQWIEVQGIDGLPTQETSTGATLGPLYGCFQQPPHNSLGPAC
jgi:hypothetical protein